MIPDLSHLLILDSLLREGSLTRTAELLGMTQPTVSRALAKLPDADAADVLRAPAVCEAMAQGLARLRANGGGSSSFATRALLLADLPSVDGGEITDKGYINQRAVLEHRAGLIEDIYARQAQAGVISV